jgi:hypothetical protein
MYKKIHQINSLNLPDDIINIIHINYKYNMLEIKYKRDYDNVMNFLQHYIFLNKKINKKNHKNYSLLDTIKYFD